jgi:3-dehydroquinate synthase
MSPREVMVELGDRSYPVVIGSGVLTSVGERLATLGHSGRCALLTSERVGALYREPVVAALRGSGFDPVVVEIPDGEEHKSLAWLALVYDRFLEAGIERGTPLVALGGGVIGDLGGFAGATLLRGLPVVQVPTTLLAQVDAAIGGKTAVNHAQGKNLLGVFHQPRCVLADVDVLATLPRRELLAGLAEVIKYGVIGDAGLFDVVERQLRPPEGGGGLARRTRADGPARDAELRPHHRACGRDAHRLPAIPARRGRRYRHGGRGLRVTGPG